MSKVDDNLQDSKKVFETISSILQVKRFGTNKRQVLLMSYFDICMEHIQAINLLVIHKLYGSSFALVRPFYDTFYRALWMLKCASDIQIDEIRNDKFKFSKMHKKIEEIDKAYTGTDFFKKLKESSWKTMCGYTHSGTPQLSRRWNGDELQPDYKEGEIIEVLRGTKTILLLFAFTILKEHNYPDDAEKINDLLL